VKCLMKCLNKMILDHYDELLEEAELDLVVMVASQACKGSVDGITHIRSNGESFECKVRGEVMQMGI
jgi:hypothetical protein